MLLNRASECRFVPVKKKKRRKIKTHAFNLNLIKNIIHILHPKGSDQRLFQNDGPIGNDFFHDTPFLYECLECLYAEDLQEAKIKLFHMVPNEEKQILELDLKNTEAVEPPISVSFMKDAKKYFDTFDHVPSKTHITSILNYISYRLRDFFSL